RRSNDQTHLVAGLLVVGDVDLLADIACEIVNAGMLDNSDDYGPSAIHRRILRKEHDLEALADAVLPGPGALGERLVDYDGVGMILVVGVGEEAAGGEFHSCGFEIAGRDNAPIGGDAFPSLRGSVVVGVRSLWTTTRKRKAIDAADGLHAG